MTEPTLRDKIIALPTQNGAVWKRDILVILDAHTAAQPAPDLCDVCGGHGMAGHPDSGAVCIPCNGTGGVKPAPDAVAEADDIDAAYKDGWGFAYRQWQRTGSVPDPEHTLKGTRA